MPSRCHSLLAAMWMLLGLDPLGAATLTRGPFVQNATTQSIQVLWHTSTPASTEVEYGPTPELGQRWENSDPATNHLATIKDLAAGTTYFYRVRSQDGSGAVQSEVASFRTFTGSGPVRFLVVGDSPGRNFEASPDAAQVAAAMRREPADLVLHCGDVVYYGIPNLDVEFFSIFQPQMQTVPFYLVAGNHDLDWPNELTGISFQEAFALPTNSLTGTEQFYSFDHGDVHFVGLFNPWFRDYVFSSDTIQFQWLTNDLAASTQPWKILFLHFPVATSALHATDNFNGGPPDHVEMMNLLMPAAQQHGVQMIFGSHDHDYERFAPTNGVHHLVTGGGGRGLYRLFQPHPAFAQFRPIYHFIRASVEGDTMLLEAVNTNGAVFDSMSVTRAVPSPRVWPASWNTPVIETGAADDGDGNINGQSFDFVGSPIPALAGQFSNLGRMFVNNDDTHLYLGLAGAALYSGNNLFVFVEAPRLSGVGTMAGLGDGMFDPDGEGVEGLDCLENLSFTNFSPGLACLLGDEFADGQFRSFTRSNLALNIGQGVFYLDPFVGSFRDVSGARLQQYNCSPQTNELALNDTGVDREQNADYIEVAIPLAALGNARPGEILRIAALVGGRSYNLDAGTRELDTGFVGAFLSGMGEDSVRLEGAQVRLAGDPANPDWDGDGLTNEQEELAGTDPHDPSSVLRVGLERTGDGRLRLSWSAVLGKRYYIQRSTGALADFIDLADPALPRTATSALEIYNLAWPDAATSVFFRVRLAP